MFYGIPKERQQAVADAIRVLLESYQTSFVGDMMVSVDRNMGFFDDPKFMEAFNGAAGSDQERSLVWRLHVLCWCAETSLRREGEFVECGVYRGLSTRVAARYLDFATRGKEWYLYDTFSGIPEDQLNTGHINPLTYQDPGLHEYCLHHFAGYPNIHVIRGKVPDILHSRAPQKVAFLHLDMNSADAEAGALEFFFDRLTPGAIVLLDDYGWRAYREQKLVADKFFAGHNGKVMELPTGQGLFIN